MKFINTIITIENYLILTSNRSFLTLNLALIFVSTSAVLGRYITLDSTVATWARCIIALFAIYGFCLVAKVPIKFDNKKSRNWTILCGVLMGVHWVTYFYALDYSNAAIALLTLYTFPAFTTLLEPLFTDLKLEWYNIILAIISLMGVAVINPSFDFDNQYSIAIGLGLISAITYALRNIFIRVPAKSNHGSTLMLHQIVVVSILLAPCLFFLDTSGWQEQIGGLLLLALMTTAIGHSLFVMSLKEFSATTAGLLSCVIPVYALLWAYLFLGEVPSSRTIVGGLIILSTVIVKTILDQKKTKNES